MYSDSRTVVEFVEDETNVVAEVEAAEEKVEWN